MRLLSFQVKNFKSVIDSGECTLASDLTVLAGKNEAGKTNILEGLLRFNRDQKFDSGDTSLETPGEKPEITCTFELSKDEIKKIVTEMGVEINPEELSNQLTVTKTSEGKFVYDSGTNSVARFILEDLANQSKLAKSYEKNAHAIMARAQESGYTATLPEGLEIPKYTNAATLFNELVGQLGSVPEEEPEGFRKALEVYKKAAGDYDQAIKATQSKHNVLLAAFPKIILFDSFHENELLPYEIALRGAKKNRALMNLCKVAGLSIDEIIATTDTQQRNQLVNNKSAKVQGDFGEYWNQDEVNLKIKSYGDKLLITVEEADKLIEYKVEQRSKGLQWFLSFYLLMKVEAEGNSSIILIDEPGLYVHAQAQQDILKVLEDVSDTNQIVYTTHSPYLIDPARLDRIRLVIKNLSSKQNRAGVKAQGSKVYEISKVGADAKDTLTPIITAIGLDISSGLTFASTNNVVLEGISDYNFIMALKESTPATLKSKLDKVHFIPCIGADNIPSVVSLLIGWGLQYSVLLDNDSKGVGVASKLREKLGLDKEIVLVSSEENFCIEDVLTKEDFNKFVLSKAEDYETAKLNSEVIPSNQKVILSRKFWNDCREGKVKLSTQSKDNFSRIAKSWDLGQS